MTDEANPGEGGSNGGGSGCGVLLGLAFLATVSLPITLNVMEAPFGKKKDTLKDGLESTLVEPAQSTVEVGKRGVNAVSDFVVGIANTGGEWLDEKLDSYDHTKIPSLHLGEGESIASGEAVPYKSLTGIDVDRQQFAKDQVLVLKKNFKGGKRDGETVYNLREVIATCYLLGFDLSPDQRVSGNAIYAARTSTTYESALEATRAEFLGVLSTLSGSKNEFDDDFNPDEKPGKYWWISERNLSSTQRARVNEALGYIVSQVRTDAGAGGYKPILFGPSNTPKTSVLFGAEPSSDSSSTPSRTPSVDFGSRGGK